MNVYEFLSCKEHSAFQINLGASDIVSFLGELIYSQSLNLCQNYFTGNPYFVVLHNFIFHQFHLYCYSEESLWHYVPRTFRKENTVGKLLG